MDEKPGDDFRIEWHFSNVPPEQIEGCFYYEYARANRPITDCIRLWREKIGKDLKRAHKAALTSNNTDPRGKAFNDALRELTPLVGQHFFLQTAAFLLSRQIFPDTPWQSLRKADKRAWNETLNLYRHVDTRKGGLREIVIVRGNVTDFYSAQFERFKVASEGSKKLHVEVVPFEIDWRGGDGKVIADFTRWARKRWAHLKHKKKPRSLYPEWLKQLGVMRLKDRLGSWSKAQKYSEQILGYPLYKDDENLWRRARLAAKKRVKQMFPMTGTPAGASVT